MRDAGLDDRFRYWRGASGRRYLFSVVPAEALADFRDCVAIVAEAMRSGHHIARAVFVSDARRVAVRAGETVFIHLLATTEDERDLVVADLTAASFRMAA